MSIITDENVQGRSCGSSAVPDGSLIEKKNVHNQVQNGDFVLCYFSHENITGITIELPDGLLHNKWGRFYHSDMVGTEFGTRIRSRNAPNGHYEKGYTFLCRPTPELISVAAIHRTQIIFHADISLILMLLDVKPGAVFVEAGTGSGSLSSSIAHNLRPTGKLYTFEFHEERQQQAMEMFKTSGFDDVVVSQHGDACEEGFVGRLGDNTAVDGVFLDLPCPWLATKNALKVLRPNGRLVTFSPCIEQVSKTVESMRQLDMKDVRTFECLSKPWNLTNPKKRGREHEDGSLHQLSMRGHTSYITVATIPLPDEDDLE